ncbi:MAG: ABC transporter permease [Clostridiales bacterium]|nr:ABC transporter permease [Clostridiales bacterium]
MLLKYLKMIFRDKSSVFWALLFPLVLMCLFKATFGNIIATENSLDERKCGIVLDGEGMYQNSFKTMMDAIEEGDSEGLKLTNLYTTKEDASDKLKNEELDFYYIVDDDSVTVFLSENYSLANGMIAREIADTYRVNMDMVSDCLSDHPEKISELTEELNNRLSYIEIGEDEGTDMYRWYFISTLVMGILFDYQAGLRVLGYIRADVSGAAMRVAISSSSKTRIVISSLLAQLIVSISKVTVHVLFMKFVIGLDMFARPLLLVITLVCAIVFSICLGILMGLFFNGDVQSRENKTLGIVMLSSFLSGEMIVTLPGYIEKFCPIVNRINPATIFNKIFYRLLICENTGDLTVNLIGISIASVVMLMASILILRRETYASL